MYLKLKNKHYYVSYTARPEDILSAISFRTYNAAYKFKIQQAKLGINLIILLYIDKNWAQIEHNNELEIDTWR